MDKIKQLQTDIATLENYIEKLKAESVSDVHSAVYRAGKSIKNNADKFEEYEQVKNNVTDAEKVQYLEHICRDTFKKMRKFCAKNGVNFDEII